MIDASIIQDYLNGTSLAGISRKYGMTAYVAKHELIKAGIKIRSRNEQNKYSPQNQRIYKVNDLYFSEQSPNMVYLLGMLASDGSINSATNEVKLTLAAVDEGYLEMVRDELKAERPIHTYESARGFKSSSLSFTSYQIKKDLADYNIVPRKTYSFTFPQKIKKEHYRDFIRGYFDGDGSVSTAGKSAIRWQLCSYTPDVLEKTMDFFYEQGIPKVSLQKRLGEHLYNIQYSNSATRKIYDILYYDNCFCLPRKKDKFEALMK